MTWHTVQPSCWQVVTYVWPSWPKCLVLASQQQSQQHLYLWKGSDYLSSMLSQIYHQYWLEFYLSKSTIAVNLRFNKILWGTLYIKSQYFSICEGYTDTHIVFKPQNHTMLTNLKKRFWHTHIITLYCIWNLFQFIYFFFGTVICIYQEYSNHQQFFFSVSCSFCDPFVKFSVRTYGVIRR